MKSRLDTLVEDVWSKVEAGCAAGLGDGKELGKIVPMIELPPEPARNVSFRWKEQKEETVGSGVTSHELEVSARKVFEFEVAKPVHRDELKTGIIQPPNSKRLLAPL